VGKGEAEKVWKRLKPGGELLTQMLAAISAARRSVQWQRENGRYIPNPATWLNQRRWEDELTVENAGGGRFSNLQRLYETFEEEERERRREDELDQE